MKLLSFAVPRLNSTVASPLPSVTTAVAAGRVPTGVPFETVGQRNRVLVRIAEIQVGGFDELEGSARSALEIRGAGPGGRVVGEAGKKGSGGIGDDLAIEHDIVQASAIGRGIDSAIENVDAEGGRSLEALERRCREVE